MRTAEMQTDEAIDACKRGSIGVVDLIEIVLAELRQRRSGAEVVNGDGRGQCDSVHSPGHRCVFGLGHAVTYHSDGEFKWPVIAAPSPSEPAAGETRVDTLFVNLYPGQHSSYRDESVAKSSFHLAKTGEAAVPFVRRSQLDVVRAKLEVSLRDAAAWDHRAHEERARAEKAESALTAMTRERDDLKAELDVALIAETRLRADLAALRSAPASKGDVTERDAAEWCDENQIITLGEIGMAEFANDMIAQRTPVKVEGGPTIEDACKWVEANPWRSSMILSEYVHSYASRFARPAEAAKPIGYGWAIGTWVSSHCYGTPQLAKASAESHDVAMMSSAPHVIVALVPIEAPNTSQVKNG